MKTFQTSQCVRRLCHAFIYTAAESERSKKACPGLLKDDQSFLARFDESFFPFSGVLPDLEQKVGLLLRCDDADPQVRPADNVANFAGLQCGHISSHRPGDLLRACCKADSVARQGSVRQLSICSMA